jgi:hypothetical protein
MHSAMVDSPYRKNSQNTRAGLEFPKMPLPVMTVMITA